MSTVTLVSGARVTVNNETRTITISGTGTQGVRGDAGRQFWHGEGAPAADLGANGDVYLNELDGAIWDKAAGVWTASSNLYAQFVDDAHDWAIEEENVPVDDGVHGVGFSSYHWALRSAESAAASQASADDAADIVASLQGGAMRLLGGEAGTAVVFDIPDFATIGGASPVTGGTPFAAGRVEYTRAYRAYDYDGDGLIAAFEPDEPILAHSPTTGEALGLAIRDHTQSIIWNEYDLTVEYGWSWISGLTAVPSDETDPAGGLGAWLVTDTSDTLFAQLTNAEYAVPAVDNQWYTWGAWYKFETSALVQQKPVIGQTPADPPHRVTGNATYDIETGQVNAVLAGQEAEVIPHRNGWNLALLHAKNNAFGNDEPTWHVIPAVAAAGETTAVHIYKPFVLPNKQYTGHRPSSEGPRAAPLDGALHALIYGSATFGTVTFVNDFTQDIANAAWTKSNADVVTVPGVGLGGADAYTITDTSDTVQGFVQATKASGVGDDEYVEVCYVLHRNLSSGRFIDGRGNFFSGGTVFQPIFKFDWRARRLFTLTGDTTGAIGQIVPIDDNRDMVMMQYQNNGTGNVAHRANVYPSTNGNSSEDFATISNIIVSRSATPFWTELPVVPLEPDAPYIDLTDKPWNGLTGTIFKDTQDLPSPALGERITIFEAHSGTDNGRIWAYFTRTSDTGPVYAYGVDFISNDGLTTQTATMEDIERLAARWSVAWDDTSIIPGRNDTEGDASPGATVRPTGIDTLHIGNEHDGLSAMNSIVVRGAHIARKKTIEWIWAAGGTNASDATAGGPFTTAILTTMAAITLAARNLLLARVRSNLPNFLAWALSFVPSKGQSLARGAYSNIPPYTIWEWIEAQPWFHALSSPLMFGGSLRDDSSSTTVYAPISDMDGTNGGTAGAFNRLGATADGGNSVLTAAQLEAQSPAFSSGFVGENPASAAEYEFKLRNMEARGITTDTAHRTVGLTVGSQAESTIAQLAGTVPDGSDSNPWVKFKHSLTVIRDYALANGFTIEQLGMLCTNENYGEAMKGTAVSSLLNGGTSTTGIGLEGWQDNINALNVELFDKSTLVPSFQTLPGMHWVDDSLTVSDAYHQMETDRDDVIIVNGSWALQNSGTVGSEHPTALLGSALDGLMKARARQRVIGEGANTFIPEPWRLYRSGRYFALCVLIEDEPIKRKQVYGTYSPQLADAYQSGLRVMYGSNEYRLRSDPTIHSSGRIIQFETESIPPGECDLVIGGQTKTFGRHEWFDSGEDFTRWLVRFLPYEVADRIIPALDGLPLSGNRPMRNRRIRSQPWLET